MEAKQTTDKGCRLKIRIFALAKELGLDSKDLIQHCNDAGLDVKSSPLASITPDERDVLMNHLQKIGGSGPSSGPAEAEPAIPAREEMRPHVPIREIRDLGPLAGQMRTRRPPRKESAQSPEAEFEVAATTPEVAVATVEPEPVVEIPAVVEPPVAAEISPPVVEIPQEVPPSEVPVQTVAEPAPPPAPPVAEKPVETMRPRAPISRSDYIGPGGVGGMSAIREMKPHGSVRPTEAIPNRRDKKRGPVLPSLAQPSFKPPVIKKTEELVQKPDLALTGDVLKKNKLADILKKNRDDATRRPTVAEEEEVAAKGKAQRGLSLEEAREARRKKRQKTRTGGEDEDVVVKTAKRHRRSVGATERKSEATISVPITIRSLSEAMGRPARDLITVLFKQGKMVTINDIIEEETALEIAMEMGVELNIEQETDFEDVLEARISSHEGVKEAEMQIRPPIITVLGHVDHGKTTLVDRLRASNVAAGEAGGITQHIAAYQVTHNGQKLTFVDTPGHAAFGEMRARGANVTDIIVLVVAADDGVMPQTVECISHAKAAGVPIVVAMNKIDLPNVNQQKVLTELSQHGILPSEWGGDVEVVRVSGLQGIGIDDLLETLLVTAELNELKSPVDVPADGVCLEAFRDEGRGPLAWVIIRQGTLRVGDLVLCGPAYGRVRAMYTDRGEEIQSAGPSTPVKIAGLDQVPGAGDHVFVMDDIDEAREYAEQRRSRGRTASLAGRGGPMSLEDFFSARGAGVKDLPLIIKADTPGSLEAIRGELMKIEHPEVRIKILHEGVGGVNESDIYLAASTSAIVIAFHVIAEDRAESLAAQEEIEIRRYKIIYKVTEDIRKALEGLLEPEKIEVPTGRALVLRTFSISRVGTVAGCRVLNGTIDRSNRVHVIRDQTILNSYSIASLKREKDDAREVREGFECGIRLEGFNDVKEGDLLEAFRIDERKRSLDE
ncbi:translation initiation factor IF-2 [Planctomicrobium sp. SH664]|uniref:translation initiation factor IF-2 n=1 Tax=Planctomicrobium sp. SH664 TaxID=3448125 RepID=UPI003F5BF5CE